MLLQVKNKLNEGKHTVYSSYDGRINSLMQYNPQLHHEEESSEMKKKNLPPNAVM